jgi:hypothetical protein
MRFSTDLPGPSRLTPPLFAAPIPLRPKPPSTARIHTSDRAERVYASQQDHIMDKYDDMLSKLPALEAWSAQDESVRTLPSSFPQKLTKVGCSPCLSRIHTSPPTPERRFGER